MARLRTEPMAPWSSPCSEGETRWVIIDWDAGPASAHRQLMGMARRKSSPVGGPAEEREAEGAEEETREERCAARPAA